MDYKYFFKHLGMHIACSTLSIAFAYVITDKKMDLFNLLLMTPYFFGTSIGISYQITKSKELS
jgi:hypothetical protein